MRQVYIWILLGCIDILLFGMPNQIYTREKIYIKKTRHLEDIYIEEHKPKEYTRKRHIYKKIYIYKKIHIPKDLYIKIHTHKENKYTEKIYIGIYIQKDIDRGTYTRSKYIYRKIYIQKEYIYKKKYIQRDIDMKGPTYRETYT